MTPAESLSAHLAQRPEMPRPFDPYTAEAIAWQRAFQWWVGKKQDLEWNALGIVIDSAERSPRCLPPAEDYVYREPVARKRKRPPRPAWSGATKEYVAQKSRESKARRRQAALDAVAERKAHEAVHPRKRSAA